MRPITVMMRRAGVDEDTAIYYVELAEELIRSRLRLDINAILTEYGFQTAEIATLLYQQDTSSQHAAASLGYTSKSVSEGGVSKSETGMTGAAISETYAARIEDILNGLDGGGVMFW